MTNEREAFEARFHMLDRSTTSNAWGEFRFLHQPVQDLWEGWKARAAIAEQPQGEDRMRRALTIIANWSLPPTGKFWDEEKTRPTSYEAEYGSNGAREYMKTLAAQALLASPIAHPQPTERGAGLSDADRFAWIAKHFTHIGGVYVKDHEVHKFDFRCGDDAPMGDEADADRLRAMVDAAAPQKGEA